MIEASHFDAAEAYATVDRHQLNDFDSHLYRTRDNGKTWQEVTRGLARGAYVLADAPAGKPEVVLMASGSEVSLCALAHDQLTAMGIRSRVVSMPSWRLFEEQPKEYKDKIFPPNVRARIAVEAGTTLGWKEYVGLEGKVVARSEAAGRPISAMDALIAATAETHDMTLVTRNTSDFEASLRLLINPWAEDD